mgnify:CR=1 FL=1
MTNENIRNVAIIAHVDHGKTTLVDQLLRQSGVFRANEQVQERVMDSGDLERERGITILSKNTAVNYKGVRINIVDTPGHADFGGEVERILQMVDGVLLLVDAFEGCMPQTRFVLGKALALGKVPVVVVNKVDRPGARPLEVVDETLELFMDLGATAEQLDFPVVYASARDGYSGLDPDHLGTDMQPLFDTILSAVPAPGGDSAAPLQILFSTIDYDDYVGRIGVGRIVQGTARRNEIVTLCGGMKDDRRDVKLSRLYRFEGLKRVEVEQASAGEIVAVAGVTGLSIGETACDPEHVEPLPFVHIDEPTVSMMFLVNDSPFAGKEGKYVTSRNLRDRLFKEVETNVSMRVEETDSTDMFKVSGRGELHLSILIETMRREGYEFQVSPPRVLYQEIDGVKCEPMERLVVDVPADAVGAVIEKMGSRKGDLLEMTPVGTRMKIEFLVPARGLFGYRNEFLTDTRGEGIMASVFDSYAPYKGDLSRRNTGSLIAFETGESITYGLFNAQERGALFIGAGVPVYAGMVVGVSPKQEDITVNVCKKKQLTNMRASGSDDALRLVPYRQMSLEQCLEFLADDELLEVTPKNLRIRKRILDHEKRMKALKGGKK